MREIINFQLKLFLEQLNKTNLTEEEKAESISRNVFGDIYSRSKEESKIFLFTLLILLLVGSFISSIANLFVIFIFKFNLNKNLKRELQNNIDAVNNNNIELNSVTIKHKESIQNQSIHLKASVCSSECNNYGQQPKLVHDKEKNQEKLRLFSKYSYMKKKLVFNTNLKLFYTLVRYLAMIDLLTCSVAIPVSVYEIWNNMKINELSCKAFEFIRAISVMGSNFILILVAFERYMAICKMKSFQLNTFKCRVVLLLFSSISIAVICMLQVSVYQRAKDSIVLIGYCLRSNVVFREDILKTILYGISFIFFLGGLFTSVMYILIFKKTFNVNKRHTIRKKNENKLLKKAVFNQDANNVLDEANPSVANNEKINQVARKLTLIQNENGEKCKCVCLKVNRNIRIAFMILMVTFIYYLFTIYRLFHTV